MPALTRKLVLPARERLLDAAARVFARSGFEGATTREIARQAKVNEVTLFRHFQSKEKLLGVVIQRTFGQPAPVPVTNRRRPRPTLRGDLQRFAERYDELLQRNISLIRTLIGEIHRHRQHETRVKHAIFAPLKAELHATLQAARDRGAIRPGVDPTIAADLFSGLIFMGVLRRSLPFGREYPPDRYLPAAVEVFARGIES